MSKNQTKLENNRGAAKQSGDCLTIFPIIGIHMQILLLSKSVAYRQKQHTDTVKLLLG